MPVVGWAWDAQTRRWWLLSPTDPVLADADCENGSAALHGPGRSPRAALAVNAAPGSLPRQHFLHYFSEEVSRGERGIRTSEKTPSLTLTE